MQLKSREHAKTMQVFEQQNPHLDPRREPKESWHAGFIYCNGETNKAFLMFRAGASFGALMERLDWPSDA